MNNGYKMPEQNKSKGGNGSNSRKSNKRRLLHHMSSKEREGGPHKKATHEMQIVNYKFAIKIFNRMKHFAFTSLSFG